MQVARLQQELHGEGGAAAVPWLPCCAQHEGCTMPPPYAGALQVPDAMQYMCLNTRLDRFTFTDGVTIGNPSGKSIFVD
jgi:hypothetical protein